MTTTFTWIEHPEGLKRGLEGLSTEDEGLRITVTPGNTMGWREEWEWVVYRISADTGAWDGEPVEIEQAGEATSMEQAMKAARAAFVGLLEEKTQEKPKTVDGFVQKATPPPPQHVGNPEKVVIDVRVRDSKGLGDLVRLELPVSYVPYADNVCTHDMEPFMKGEARCTKCYAVVAWDR